LKNKIIININYITNFNPNFFKNFKNFKNKNKKKIICRNFFLFLFLLNFLNKSLYFNSIKLFIKPKKKQFNNILKAPYKNKLSKNQIGFNRYFINFKIIFYLKIFFFKNFFYFFNFIKIFLNFFKFFETNIIYNYKINIYFNFALTDFFEFKKLK
jgi:hypothetical protein